MHPPPAVILISWRVYLVMEELRPPQSPLSDVTARMRSLETGTPAVCDGAWALVPLCCTLPACAPPDACHLQGWSPKRRVNGSTMPREFSTATCAERIFDAATNCGAWGPRVSLQHDTMVDTDTMRTQPAHLHRLGDLADVLNRPDPQLDCARCARRGDASALSTTITYRRYLHR